MSWQAIVQALVLVGLLAATVPFLGRTWPMCTEHERTGRRPGSVLRPGRARDYRICGIDARREQRWNVYATSLLAFSLVSVLLLYAMHRLQGVLPFNPTDRAGVSPMGSFNAAISFVTNMNWQRHDGES